MEKIEDKRLRVRWLIEQRFFLTAEANRDLARLGEWRSDYTQCAAAFDIEIEQLFGEIGRLNDE